MPVEHRLHQARIAERVGAVHVGRIARGRGAGPAARPGGCGARCFGSWQPWHTRLLALAEVRGRSHRLHGQPLPSRAWKNISLLAGTTKCALPSASTGHGAQHVRTGTTESPAAAIRRPVSCGGPPDGTDIGSTWQHAQGLDLRPRRPGPQAVVDVDHRERGLGLPRRAAGRAEGRSAASAWPAATPAGGGVGRSGDRTVASDLRVAVDQLLVAETVQQVNAVVARQVLAAVAAVPSSLAS